MMAKIQCVQIKGTREGLIIFLNPTCEFDELKNSLLRQLDRARDFFGGARFTIHHEKKSLPVEQKQELVSIVTQYGLVYTEDIFFPTAPVSRAKPAVTAPTSENTPEKAEKPLGLEAISTPALPTGAEAALFVRRSIRSGQSASSENHLVIDGDVHPGASITAAGSIVVLGSLMGSVAAGSFGNRKASVTAHKLSPIVLSIAGVVAPPLPKPLVDGKAVLRGSRVMYSTLRRPATGGRKLPEL
ncbi:MAG: hypothetical protein C4570_04815 [Ammonifex sp.]|nr:MAG: hypothetical protein C4570_04815 [Ammonifex sp.]